MLQRVNRSLQRLILLIWSLAGQILPVLAWQLNRRCRYQAQAVGCLIAAYTSLLLLVLECCYSILVHRPGFSHSRGLPCVLVLDVQHHSYFSDLTQGGTRNRTYAIDCFGIAAAISSSQLPAGMADSDAIPLQVSGLVLTIVLRLRFVFGLGAISASRCFSAIRDVICYKI